MKFFRLSSLAFILLFAVVIAAQGLSPATPPARAATHQVSITDAGFVPPLLTISLGDTVQWTNNSSITQIVSSDLGGLHPNHFNSFFLYTTQTFSHVFPQEGTVPYRSLTTPIPITGTVEIIGTPVPTATATTAGGPGGGGTDTHYISITDGGFVPSSLDIVLGDTVIWTNNSSLTQIVSSDLGGLHPNHFNSFFLYTTQTFSHEFPQEGAVPYRSLTTAIPITGTINVGGGGGGATSTPTPPGSTATPTPTSAPTNTATPTPTTAPGSTATPTATSAPGSTATPTATSAPGSTATPTATSAPGSTATPTATSAPGSTATPTATSAPGSTATPTPTSAPGNTPPPTAVPTGTPGPGPFGDPDDGPIFVPGLVRA